MTRYFSSLEEQGKRSLYKSLFSSPDPIFSIFQTFISILDEVAKIDNIINRNEDLVTIITLLRDTTQLLLGFRCES